MSQAPLQVGFFATCLVDLFRPAVGFAALALLEEAGCEVVVPVGQSCCGQPAFNSGDRAGAARFVRRLAVLFEDCEVVVVPSGSCAAMLKLHAVGLFTPESADFKAASALADKVVEITQFLTARGWQGAGNGFSGKLTYHDACSGLRELHIKDEPRALLAGLPDVTLIEAPDCEACCGFGGAFCVKYPEISSAMVAKKTENLAALNVDHLVAGDLGCLMNLAGRLTREGKAISVRHLVEILAPIPLSPAIATGGKEGLQEGEKP